MFATNLHRLSGAIVALGLILGLAAKPTLAATLTWNTSSGTWSTSSTNWIGASVATPWDAINGPAFVADFNTASSSATVSGTVNVNGIQFDNAAMINGGIINLLPGTLSTPTITTNASGGTIGSALTGAAGLKVTGGGILTLTGANSLTGILNVSGGTLLTSGLTTGSNNANVGGYQFSATGINVVGGAMAMLKMGSNFASANTGTVLSGAGTIQLSGGNWSLGNGGGVGAGTTIAMSPGGLISVQAGALLRNDYSNAVWLANQGSLYVASGGSMDLRNNNTLIDALNGAGAVYDNGYSNTLFVGAAGGSGTFSGTIGLGGLTVSLAKMGAGTQTLTGSNTYTGSTSVYAGTLKLDYSAAGAAANILPATAAVTLGGGALAVTGSAGATSPTLGVLTLQGGGGLTVANAGGNTTLTLASLTRNSGALTANISSGAGSNTLTITSPTGIPAAGTAIGWATVTDATGTGFGTLSGNNLVRYVTASTSALSSTSNSSSTDFTTNPATDTGAGQYSGGILTMASGPAALNTLTINTASAGGTLNLGGNVGASALSLTSSGVLMTGGNNFTIQDGQIGADSNETDIHVLGSGVLTVSGSVGSGTGNLAKGGPGMLVLTGSNVYTGATAIGGGTLQLAGGGMLNGGVYAGSILNGGTLVFSSSANQTFSGVISGGGGLTMNGRGLLSLGGASAVNQTYAGPTVVSGGTLQVFGGNSGVNAGIGHSSSLTINNGGTLVGGPTDNGMGLTSPLPVTIYAGGLLTSASTTTNHIAGILTLSGGTLGSPASVSGDAATYGVYNLDGFIATSGGTATSTISAQDMALTHAGGVIFSVPAGAANGIDLNVTGTFYHSPNSGVADNGLIKAGNGLMRLSGANSYNGNTTISGGTLQVGIAGAIPTGASKGNVVFNAGSPATLDINGFDTTINGLVQNSPSMTNMVVNDASGTNTLTVGNNNTTSTFAGVLANNNNGGSGVLALTKTGNGALTLGGNNTYTGATSVAGGTLYLNGANANTSLSVAASATLGGNGSASSATATIASGATVSGGYNAAGTLGLGGLTFLGGGTVSIGGVSNYSAVPAINVGTLTTAATPITVSVAGSLASGSGSAHVIGYSGSIGGSGFNFVPPPSTARNTYAVVNDPGYVDFTYTIDNPYWTGAGNGMWTVANQSPNYNWSLVVAGTGTNYIAGDTVIFDNRATNTNVTIADATVSPASITVNNDGAHNYVFSGSGAIAGSIGLTKSGAGTLTIATTNSYTGATTIAGGTVYVGADGAAGASAPLGNVPSSATAGNIVLNGGALSANNSFTLAANRGIALGPAGGSGSGTIDVSGTNSLAYGGVMANASGGTGGLTKTGSGTLVLTNRETYTGPTAINGGIVELNISNGATGVFNVASSVSVSNATIKLDSDNSYGGYGDGSGGPGGASGCAPLTLYAGGQITAGGSTHIGTITLQGGTLASFGYNTLYGGWFLNGNITATGSTTSTISAQNLVIGNGNPITFTVNAGSILNFNGSTYATYGPSNTTSGTLNVAGSGLLVVTGANAQSGGTTLSGGTAQLGNGGSSGDLGPAPIVNNAVLAFNRNDNPIYTNSLSGTGTIAQIGTGIVTLAGPIGDGATPSVLHLQGPGTLVVTGYNTYTGATTINSGKLYVNGTGAIASSSGITVNNRAVFGGNPSTTIASPVSVNNGGIIDCGDGTGNGVLYLQSLALGSVPTDHTFINTYPGEGTSATLNVAGNNALLASGTASINVLGSNLSVGSYTLINYSGSIDFSKFAEGTLPTRVVGSLVNTPDTGSGGNIALDITAIDRPIWTGATNNKWDTNQADLNWTGYYFNTAQYYFESGDQVQFDDNANGSGDVTVNVAANVNPASVNFLNSARSYTLTGSGAITDSNSASQTTLAVGGGGLVVLANGANSYSGQTTITNGTLQIGNGGNSGQLGTGSVNNGGVLVLNRSDNVTVADSIGGAGAIFMQGPGNVTFSGGSFTGLLTIQAGTLVAAGQNALGGSGGQGAVVLTGATFDVNGQNLGYKSGVSGNSITISGSGAGGNGAIVNSGPAQANALQFVVLAGDATIGGAGNWEIGGVTQSPVVTGELDLAGFTLTKTNSNEVDLLEATVTDGNIIVHHGTLGVFTGTSLLDNGTGTTVQVDSGAMLEFERNVAGTITRAIVMNGGTMRTTNIEGVTIGSNITFTPSTTSTLLADQNAGMTLTGSLSGSGNVVKAAAVGGAANLNLTGDASGFSGTWTQNSGVTYFSSANAASALANYVIQTTDPAAPAILAANVSSPATFNLGSLSGSSGTLESTAAGAATFAIGANLGEGSRTTYGGVIQDGSSAVAIQIVGSGSLTLTGTNTYTGGTTVNDGTLIAANSQAIADGTNLYVGDPTLLSQLPAPVIPAPVAGPSAGAASAVSPVPEPGTLLLLAAAAAGAIMYRRIWRK